MMNKLTLFVEEKIAPPLIKFSQMKYIQVLQRTGLGIMSLLVIGSIFLLLASFPIPAWTNFLGDFRWTIAAASGVGTGFIALYTVITTSYALVEYYNKNNGENNDIVQPLILAVASFLLLIPAETVQTIVEGSTEPGSFTGVATTYLGALGVFTGLVVGIVTVELYRFFVNKKLVIKLPENVPSMVSQAFVALIPSALVIVFWWLIGAVFAINIPEVISSIFEPLVAVGDTPAAVMIITLLNRLLWAVGIHGGNIVSGVAGTFWTQMNAANLSALEVGVDLPYTFTSVFMDNYIWIGLAPMAIVMMRSKSPRIKTLGILAFPAALFNIGEPLIFGLPIMMNPLMMIPFIISYVIMAISSIGLTLVGILPVPVLTIPWITPAPIKTFLATNGSLIATGYILLGWVVMGFIFYPFIKAMEKQDLAKQDIESVDMTVAEQTSL